MKFRIVILGVLISLSQAAGSQDNPPTKSNSSAEQRLTGCLDEQDGHYVLLDDQMHKVISLQSPGSDDTWFARFMGHEVRVTGTQSSVQQGLFEVTGIEQISDSCRQGN